MNHPDVNERKRRKYRLNKKKLAGALATVAALAIFVIVVAVSLANAGIITAGADTSFPQVTGKTSQSNAELPETAGPKTSKAAGDYLIVVDAGHGGFDPGCIGVSGAHEADLNLAVAQCLKAELEARGMQVIMTREDDDGLGSTQTESLQTRRNIIEQSGSDIVISVHMNNFEENPDVSGPVALFMPGSDRGKALAEDVQASLNDALGADGSARSEDLYVLRSGSQPCVLVECGFLSNAEEEQKLQQADYQQQVAKAICDGAVAYLSGE